MSDTLVPDLRQRIREAADPLLANMGRFALMEFPAHANVGDSAIWAGEIAYLQQRHRAQPSFTGEIDSYSKDAVTAVGPLDTILVHGGGNLGDVWPRYLDSKIRLLEDFPQLPIIQLPQTVEFQSQDKLDGFRRAVARHKSFTLLVRGQASYDLARRTFDCETRLCPDMAFWLHLDRTQPAFDVVCLLRTDHEAADRNRRERLAAVDDVRLVDWLDEAPDWTIRSERWLTGLLARHPRRLAFLNPRLGDLRNRAAAGRVRRGCALLSSGRVVVTDRLHGHILCVLLGIPHVLLDNSYGKLRRFYDTWTYDCAGAHFAGSLDEALDIARGLVRSR